MKGDKLDCIVSLTSWKGRIYTESVPLHLYCLTHQKTSYNYKVVLVLSDEEFPGKEKDIPKTIFAMTKMFPNFEILWTHKNTRALKKLDPTMKRYPTVPVITTDDDIMVREDFVQCFMDCHRRNPKHIIYAHMFDFPGNNAIKVSGWRRLFPPLSLCPLDDKYFDTIFKGLEDDVWNGIRAWLAGTPVMKLGAWPFVEQKEIGNTAFYRQYSKVDPVACYNRLMAELAKKKSKA